MKKKTAFISLKKKNQVIRKEELIDDVYIKSGVPKNEIRIVVETLMHSIKEHIVQKKNVSLKGFMSFQVKKQASRRARNIIKDESIFIPARYKAIGKFSKNILRELNNNIDDTKILD